ncbi:MAG: alpha-amylase family protein [Verrucomicrobiota bacterium]
MKRFLRLIGLLLVFGAFSSSAAATDRNSESSKIQMGYPPYQLENGKNKAMEPVQVFRQSPRITSYAYGNITTEQADRVARRFWEQGFNLVLSEGNRYLFKEAADEKSSSAIRVLPYEEVIKNTKIMADACHRYGLRFFLHLTCSMVDQPLLDKHPDWAVIDIATGKTITNSYGTGNACINNDEFMAEFYKRLDRLIRETGVDGIMQDEIQFFSPSLCGCRSCREKFAKETGFQIPDKMAGWLKPSKAAWLEWRRAKVVQNLQKVRGMIKKYNPDNTVITYLCNNTTGYAYYSAGLCIDDFPKYADSAGYECEPHDYFYQYYWPHVIYEMKYLRAVAENMNTAPWTYFYDRTLDDHTFNWFVGMSQGVRRWWFDSDPLAARCWTPQVAWEKKHAKLLMNVRSAANIGVLFSLDARDRNPHRSGKRSWVQGYSSTCNALTDEHIPYKVVVDADMTAETLRRKLKTLILFNTGPMSDRAAEAVRTFVQEGGILVASGATSLFNEKGAPRKNFALADVLGCNYGGEQKDGKTLFIPATNEVTGELTGELEHQDSFVLARDLAPDVKVVGKIRAADGKEYPGILARNYGKGKVVYCSGHPEYRYLYHYYNENLIKPGQFWKDNRDPKYGRLIGRLAIYGNDELPLKVANVPRGIVTEVYRHEVCDAKPLSPVLNKLHLGGLVQAYRHRFKDLRGIQVHLANLLGGRLKEGVVPLVNEINYPEVRPNLPNPDKPITVSVRTDQVKSVYLLSPDFDATVELPFKKKDGYATVELPVFSRYDILYFSEGGNGEILRLNGGKSIRNIPPAKELVTLDRNFMVDINPNDQSVTMWASGTAIRINSKPKYPSNRSFIGFNKHNCFPTIQDLTREGKPTFMAYIPKKVELLVDTDDVKKVKMIFFLTDFEKASGKVYDDYELELQLEIRKGLPCLFLTSQVRNLGAIPFACYTFWGWFHGENYTLAGGTATPFKSYGRMPKADWIFVAPPKTASGDGMGIIPGPDSWVSDTTCSAALVFPEKSGAKLNPGETLSSSMVLFPSKSPEETQEIYQQTIEK